MPALQIEHPPGGHRELKTTKDYQFSVDADRRATINNVEKLQPYVSTELLMPTPDNTQHIDTDTSNPVPLPLYQWLPQSPAKGVVHISHGMAEYGKRYQQLARELNQADYIVYAHDHPGHGDRIAGDNSDRGHFADTFGWSVAVHDLAMVIDHILAEHSGLPCFLLGHSMGSYLLQSYLVNSNPDICGFILSGSNYVPKPLLYFARMVTRLEVLRQGKHGVSQLINQLTFTGYNKKFKPNRTDFDWLSSNQKSVDDYINDPLCGFDCSNQLWHDLFGGLKDICSINALKKIQTETPVLILGGEQDPISAPNNLQKLASAYEQAGHLDVSLHLYPEGRHEMFNETNSEQVVQRLIQWMDSHLPDFA